MLHIVCASRTTVSESGVCSQFALNQRCEAVTSAVGVSVLRMLSLPKRWEARIVLNEHSENGFDCH